MWKTLNQVASRLSQPSREEDRDLTDCWVDARQVSAGSVFIALEGTQCHGAEFIEQALERDVALILISASGLTKQQQQTFLVKAETRRVICWVVEGLAQKLPGLVSWFYDFPSHRLQVMGITGTNGKTSTAHFTAQLGHLAGKKVALMGTLGNGLWGHLKPSPNTTLEVVALQRNLAQFVAQGVDWVVMEVSSHAITLGRIAGVQFFATALTQVTRDHLDFHGNLQAYRDAKASLFMDYVAQSTVLNVDDALGQAIRERLLSGLAHSLTASSNILSYGHDHSATLQLEQVDYRPDGMRLTCHYQGDSQVWSVPLMGDFNVENLLCAVSLALVAGCSFKDLAGWVSQLKPVAGRLQLASQKPYVLVDYAHTPDALGSVLQAVRVHLLPQAKLWLVFGCGGDRDQGKRPLMGEVAQQWADQVVITDDNPRFEDPKQIVSQIIAGMQKPPTVIHARDQAIVWALSQMQNEDCLVIAGKGHEQTQEVQGKKIPFDDVVQVRQWLSQVS